MFSYHHYQLFRETHYQNALSNWSDIATIVGSLGLILGVITYWQSRKKEKSESFSTKIQTIQAIKHQLRNTVWFIGLTDEYPSGYEQKNNEYWKAKKFLLYANPLTVLNPIEYSFIQNVNLLPGIAIIDEDLNILIADYIQWCGAYNNYLTQIRNFINSRGADKNVLLSFKISKTHDKESLKTELTDEENFFVAALFSMYESLFYGVVGGAEKGYLYQCHQRLKSALEKYESQLLNKNS